MCCLVATGGFAQTNVVKTTATKSNDYGVTYFLPKTEFVIQANVSKITEKAGAYHKYAQKYLGIDNPITEDRVYYTLDEVTVATRGIPDKEQAYLIEFKSKTTAPFAYLTEDGLLCTINAPYQPATGQGGDSKPKAEEKKTNLESVYTEEYLQAGSIGKMAEVSAKQIYRLRESRLDMLTGETENVPRDGEAMKLILQELDAREKVLSEQFKGSVSVETQTFEVTLLPESDLRSVLFRFSNRLGVVDSDDLSGAPVYIDIKAIDKKPEITDPKELEKLEKARTNPKGVIYNLPGKSRVEVTHGTKNIYSGEHQVAQFGEKQVLLPTIFEDKKAPVQVFFYPETGALRQVIQ